MSRSAPGRDRSAASSRNRISPTPHVTWRASTSSASPFVSTVLASSRSSKSTTSGARHPAVPPVADALQAERVVAPAQQPEPTVAQLWFFEHALEADGALHLRRARAFLFQRANALGLLERHGGGSERVGTLVWFPRTTVRYGSSSVLVALRGFRKRAAFSASKIILLCQKHRSPRRRKRVSFARARARAFDARSR